MWFRNVSFGWKLWACSGLLLMLAALNEGSVTGALVFGGVYLGLGAVGYAIHNEI